MRSSYWPTTRSERHRRLNILLLRHGQTDQNARGVLQGHQDTPLNAVGRRQAAALAARLAAFDPRIEAIVTSDLVRAADTARPIAEALGLPVVVDGDWRERAFGQFEGRTLDEAVVWRAAAGSAELPGAEAATAFRTRIKTVLLSTLERFSGSRTVAIATHGGPIRAVLALLQGAALELADGQPLPEVVPVANCSIMHLSAACDADRRVRWRVVCVNDTAHIDGACAESGTGIVQE